ncbi:MAG: carbohydrate-binding family 9-like protein [Christensenellales bacterium]|jgi:hypothetical protein
MGAKKSMTVKNAGREALFTDAVEPFDIAIHPWEDSGYDPKVEGRICYDGAGIHIGFTVWEDQVVINHFNKNDPVSLDSCVEFFVSPWPEGSPHYANFEINAIGTFLAKNRPGPNEMQFIERSETDREFDIRTSLSRENHSDFKGPFWQVSYTVPRSVLERYFPGCELKSGAVWRANFYKCGHGDYLNHKMAWSDIKTEKPQFHSPKFFGSITLG